MSVLNDDGVPLNLSTVLILFLLPNISLAFLTILNIYLLYLSKKYPRLNRFLGKLANFFAKGALDRIIRNIIQNIEGQKRQNEEQISMKQSPSINLQPNRYTSKRSSSNSSISVFTKQYDANYLLLVPFQLDLLLTVSIYKILTRDVYFETCQTYLTTYHSRPKQIVCWLKNTNKNVSNSSLNTTIIEYCLNQTITYINYEHNDVMCTQYFFKIINIIDTVTNIFAWHQAIVFVVTNSIVFCHWYQEKLRKILCWLNLLNYERHTIISLVCSVVLSTYVIVFIILLPIRFILIERRRVDLTRQLLYACSKFIVGIVVHVNMYTFYQWQTLMTQKRRVISVGKRRRFPDDHLAVLNVSTANSIYTPERESFIINENQNASTIKYLTPSGSN